jgi:secreted PhoX family phosphatase
MLTSRRDFIKWMGAVSLGFGGLKTFANNLTHVVPEDLKDSLTLFDNLLKLPEGFSYKIIAQKSDLMNDGLFLPGRPDGMGAFNGTDGKVILIRNHENQNNDFDDSPFGKDLIKLNKISKDKIFDKGFGKTPHLGGTTTTVYNESSQKVESVCLSLAGTSRNCAGGITPWGSWITCEEDFKNADKSNEKAHGYNFEVPATERLKLKYPVPLKAMGKFMHEAVCVDPATGIVYQTEDRHEGLIYRFIPKTKGKLQDGGKLQALAFVWKKSMDTRNWEDKDTLKTGIKYAVKWLDLDGVDSEEDDLRMRGFEKGAACFARGEGMWFGKGELFFACTNGGADKTGQIFRYIPSRYEGNSRENEKEFQPRLELFVEPNNTDLMRYADNLTIAPWGDVVFCEDHKSPRITGITSKGKFYRIAENIGYPSEFAGVCFSPSGKTLFVNIQEAGLTLAITGPWKKFHS